MKIQKKKKTPSESQVCENADMPAIVTNGLRNL
uniref:Uncharacterized protein n=1 Tax=Anguilla anguilla TaxID=7936 RepID=A0A0E9R562_ANGAN